jgi:FkbM family methyltransferase
MLPHLEALGLGTPYRWTAERVADLVFRVPGFDPAFVVATRRLWKVPGLGRAARSVAYRYIDRLRGTGREFRAVTVVGIPLIGDVSHFTLTGLYFAGMEYEAATCRYIAESMPPGGTFVDIGANAGLMTLIAAARVGPSGRVFAFEPNPPVFQELERHVEVNAFGDRVRAVDCALSDVNGAARLYVTPVLSGLSSLDIDGAPGRDSLRTGYAVSTRTLRFDDWIARVGVDRVDLIKIDVEGTEDRVLAGMVGTLAARRIDRVVCETTPGGPAHRLLSSFGYESRALDSYGIHGNIAYALPDR